jgi:hypothetical protein
LKNMEQFSLCDAMRYVDRHHLLLLSCYAQDY